VLDGVAPFGHLSSEATKQAIALGRPGVAGTSLFLFPQVSARFPEPTRQLRRQTAPIATRRQKSIAVFPFVKLSADRATSISGGGGGDGHDRRLLNVLTKVKGLRVAAWPFILAFKASTRLAHFPQSPRATAREHGLEGERAQGRTTTGGSTAPLINVADVFTSVRTYDETLRTFSPFKGDVAKRVVQALRYSSVSTSAPVAKKPTEYPEAQPALLLAVIISPSSARRLDQRDPLL